MNIYASIPLIAVAAYIPLLITTISSRPWQTRHKLFILFLIAAMTWSLTDVFLRSNLSPQYNNLLLKLILITYTWMAVQFYCFASSFFAPGQGRWLPLAYASLAVVIILVLLGYVAEGVTIINGDKLHLDYGRGTMFLALPLLILAARMTYVFGKRLRILDNLVLRNQIYSLLLGLFVLILFTLVTLLPWGREYAVTHFGSIINASILSYATVRHQLVDIRIVLRRGLAWVSLGIIGAVSFSLLLLILHIVLGFEFDLTAEFVIALVAVLVAIFIYKLRGYLFITVGKAFQGQSFDYRQKLSDFASKIHNIFSLKEQGGEMLALVTRAVGCKRVRLLFLESGSQDFITQFVEPKGKDNLPNLRLSGQNPIVEYLRREQKLLTRESLTILPEFRGLWEQEKEEIKSNEIELFVPLISRDRLTGILVLDKKQSGRYSLEDLRLLEEVTNRVAVSMEKEYLRERLREREEELSVLNRSSAIISSSFDIQEIYDSFIEELKKVVDVNWAAIVLIEENQLCFLALFSEIGSAWKVGERVPIRGTAMEWVATHKEAVVEPDLSRESRFVTGKFHLKQGVHSIAYLPLIAKGEVIGSFVVASRDPNAYSQRHMMLLEQLASQMAMSIENSRLYAKAEEKARVDELTGLLNRRSLDELIASEVGRHARYGGVFSLIILDLDGFKAFNDNYGHLAGDKLLGKIGNIMKNTIRNADQAFRYGGDEFAILLPSTSIDAASQVAERIRKRVASKVKTGYIPITASFGLASWPADGIGSIEVIAAADAALYHAKRGGGNQSHCASGTLLPLDDTAVISGDILQESDTLSTLYALATTVDTKNHYTHSHWQKVKEYVVALAKALKLAPTEISKLETCALLHDIGKISISDRILNKQGKLTDEEWEAIKVHPQVGVNIASHAHQLIPCLAGILHHHERYDGNGYPKGLKGEEIPLEARILAIADAFAAMTSVRSYSDALSHEEALEEIKRGAGKQFDPHLVEVFSSAIETIPVAPTGENIRR